jgi:hypothetical protein
MLDELAHDGDPRGPQQLLELREVLAVGQGGDAHRSLGCSGLVHL